MKWTPETIKEAAGVLEGSRRSTAKKPLKYTKEAVEVYERRLPEYSKEAIRVQQGGRRSTARRPSE